MAKITEDAVFTPYVYQLGVNDPVVGGVPTVDNIGNATSGYSNVPIKQLADRTQFLKAGLDNVSGLVDQAETSAAQASTAVAQAEAARDETILNALIAADVTDGLSKTSATDPIEPTDPPRYFRIFSPDDAESFIYYRHDAGAVATEMTRLANEQRVTSISDADRRYTANGRRVDTFDTIGKTVNWTTGADFAAFTKAPGGGLVGIAQTGAAFYISELPYVNSDAGVDEYILDITVDATSSTQDLGIGFGSSPSNVVVLTWRSTGALRVLSNNGGTQLSVIAANGASRVYAAGDNIKMALRFGQTETVLAITTASGSIETYVIPGGLLPLGQAWLSYRTGTMASATFNSITVDGVSKMTLEEIDELRDALDVARLVDLFPDPALEGVSQGALWDGTVVTIDGDIAGYFSASPSKLFSWDIACVGAFRPGAEIRHEYERKSSVAGPLAARNSIVFYDVLGAEISRLQSTTVAENNVWETGVVSATIPVNAAKLTLWTGAYNSETWQRAPKLRSSFATLNLAGQSSAPAIITDRRVFVSTTGSDSNSGSEGSPLLTLAAAANSTKVSGGGDIILLDGEYSASGLNLTSNSLGGPLSLQSRYGQRARITRNQTIGAITKTAGRTKVYQCACTTAPGIWVWQHDVPDLRTLIPIAERSAYQKGRQCRLPSTAINPAVSIAAIDSAADDDPRWFWESGTLYFSVYGGGDGATADIRVPVNGNAFTVGFGSRFEMIGVDCWYGAISTTNAAQVHMHDVFAMGTRSNAIAYNSVAKFIAEMCEAAGAENDGFNSTNLTPGGRESIGLNHSAWAHDNYGDGHSDHASSLVQFDGGLYEYNGKAGIVPANGSHAVARNSHARHNGIISPNGGGGFAITNANTAGDVGVGTQFDLYGCVSEFNRFNFMCGPSFGQGGASGGSTNPDHAMRVHGGMSRGGTVAGYYARVGTMTAIDCGDAGSAAAKLEQDGGVISVLNTTRLT